ncbi:MAG TPA: HD domain-containing protein [Chitinophagaceae bacterium]
MFNEKFTAISTLILGKLKQGLPPRLSYHCISHFEDVLRQSIRIARAEDIQNEEELFLLKTAALYHDSGFMFTYTGHEEKSCEIAEEDLTRLSITPMQIVKIKGLIIATRIPQNPATHLEQVLCDADLDYLGRDDFYPIAASLYRELKAFHFVKDEKEWNRIQVDFLSSHHYFTAASIRLRNEKKLMHLDHLRKIVDSCQD